MEECAGSHLRGSCAGPATLRCGGCGALRYCSRKHQKAHWGEHAQACSRMAEQMQRAPVLYDFPFSFTHETTRSLEANETTICSLLQSWNLHGQGMWAAACDCSHPAPSSFGWTLPPSSCPCNPPPHPPPHQLQTWEDYYNWRELPFHSPAALLLHWPLSVYHALWLSQLGLGLTSVFRVHYLGPERELGQLPVFAELLALLPAVEISIEFIGPAVPEARDGESFSFSTFACCGDGDCGCKKREAVPKGSVTTRLWRGLYHERYGEMGSSRRPPDLVFAANAGVAAFPSWHRTIQLIESLDVPALFTDYCEEAAVLAVESITRGRSHLSLAFPVQVNPFRQPLSPSHKDLDLPSFSNAFMFGICGAPNVT